MRSLAMLFLVVGCSASNPTYSVDADGGSPKNDLVRPHGGPDLTEVQAVDGGAGGADLTQADGSQATTDLAPTQNDAAGDLAPNADLLPASCALPGACAPGSQQTTPDGCEERTCSSGCVWSAWGLKSGYLCCATWTQGCNAGINCATQGTQSCNATTHSWNACQCP